MSSHSTIVPVGGLVLVTGVNGFVGSHIASCLLGLGYKVRGTVRSADKASWIREAMTERHSNSSFEVVLVPDITITGAWDEAIKGVEGIVHVAGNMSFGPDPNKIITPMVNGIKNLLQVASQEPSVKRFVFTSSNRAISPQINGKEVTLDASMWNESAVEKAWHPGPYEADRAWDVYSALKTQSEQEVWKFSRERNPMFVTNSVLPCFVVGPLLHPKQPGSSSKLVLDFWKNPKENEGLQQFGASWFVDAQDTALLHVAALTYEDVRDERLLGFAGTFNYNSWLDIFRQLDPSRDWPSDDPDQEFDLCRVDDDRELELLARFGQRGWTSFFDSVRMNCLDSRL